MAEPIARPRCPSGRPGATAPDGRGAPAQQMTGPDGRGPLPPGGRGCQQTAALPDSAPGDYNLREPGMPVHAQGRGSGRNGPRRNQTPSTSWPPHPQPEHTQIGGVQVMMTPRLPAWVVLAAGAALAVAAFFGSAGITHWVMGLHHTDVVVRPGPTIYLPSPARHGHALHRAPPAPAPAGPGNAGGGPPRQDAHARPDHKAAHARPGHRGKRRHRPRAAHQRHSKGAGRAHYHRS